MRVPALVLGILAILAAGCGGGSDTQVLIDLCNERLDVPPAICDCIADRAAAELTPEGRELLVALIGQDQERAAEIRNGEISLAEITRVAAFTTSAPAGCAADASGDER